MGRHNCGRAKQGRIDEYFNALNKKEEINPNNVDKALKEETTDNIINDLDKYRKMALEESTFSNNTSQYKKY